MHRFLIFFILLGLSFASCVPNKKVVYLQTNDELKKDFVTDSVLRGYKVNQDEYRIEPNDILSIRISSLTKEEYDFLKDQNNNNQNSNSETVQIAGYLVSPDGFIEFPIIGNIKASGLTISEFESSMQQQTKGLLNSPVVRVRLLNFRVTILGEVKSEGLVNISNNEATVFELIARAGGLTDLADRKNIKLIRKSDLNNSIIYLDLLDENFLNSNYLYVQNNDILIVEPLKQRPFREYFAKNLSIIVTSISVFLLTINLIK
jgi:polysaccharide biosynthesis/export protein